MKFDYIIASDKLISKSYLKGDSFKFGSLFYSNLVHGKIKSMKSTFLNNYYIIFQHNLEKVCCFKQDDIYTGTVHIDIDFLRQI